MSKKWTVLSLCTIAAIVLAAAYSELDEEESEKEDI